MPIDSTSGPFTATIENGPATTEAQTVADIARAGAAPLQLDDAQVYVFSTPNGVQVVDGRQYGRWPDRKIGTRRVHTAASFIGYLGQQHEDQCTKVWVDDTKFAVVAVIDDHGSLAGFGDHRLALQLEQTDSWKAWAKHDGKLLDQTTFAEHIEDNAPDIIDPAAAVMLELAQSFQAKTKVDFESSQQLANGRRSLEYKETIDARAGQKGQIEIPAEFRLALKPFYGTDPYAVTARFRYRIQGGHLQIGYKLNRPADVQRSAFGDIVDAIRAGLTERAADVLVLDGTPS